VLCKHEVVGSIPSGSTSLRWLKPATARQAGSEGCHAEALAQAGHRWLDNISSAKTSFRVSSFSMRASKRVISDIVKRRSIRVGSCKGFCATLHYLQIISALARFVD
jgi:hypothetical protein